MSCNKIGALLLAIVLLLPGVLWALEPEHVLVLANRNAKDSIGLARYYMEKRGVPDDQLLMLWLTDRETCTREDYEKKVLAPVVRYLKKHQGKNIRCLVTVYGVPLRVMAPELTRAEREELEGLKKRQAEAHDCA